MQKKIRIGSDMPTVCESTCLIDALLIFLNENNDILFKHLNSKRMSDW